MPYMDEFDEFYQDYFKWLKSGLIFQLQSSKSLFQILLTLKNAKFKDSALFFQVLA